MSVFLQTETATLYLGDVVAELRSIPDCSVQCVVTSPPYWALRDYGVEGQLGLEKTPEEYVANMVAVFREVRRVLRDDGTLWLNLGSSYAGGGNGGGGSFATERPGWSVFGDRRPSRSRHDAPACGTDGTALPDSQAADRVCPDCGGERQAETCSRRGRNARTDRSASQAEQPTSQAIRDTGPVDCVQASPDALLPGVPQSTTSQSSEQLSDACGPEATVSVCQPKMPTTSPVSRPYADTKACTCGTSPKLPPLVVRTQGKESFFSACDRSDCKGVGTCGLCWCSLAIPSLNFKPKDLVSIPQLVAFALQADGWYLRSEIIWHKKSPMPESVRDRPTKSHEQIFLLSKKPRYFYDIVGSQEFGAVSVPGNKDAGKYRDLKTSKGDYRLKRNLHQVGSVAKRNMRSVWSLASYPLKAAHFAAYPPELVRRCLLAGVSENGCCAECRKPYERIVEKVRVKTRPGTNAKQHFGSNWQSGTGSHDTLKHNASDSETHPKQSDIVPNRDQYRHVTETKTTGWKSTCKCETFDAVPCTVLDPFHGAGTTWKVCERLGLHYIGIDINPEYLKLSIERGPVTFPYEKKAAAKKPAVLNGQLSFLVDQGSEYNV